MMKTSGAELNKLERRMGIQTWYKKEEGKSSIWTSKELRIWVEKSHVCIVLLEEKNKTQKRNKQK